MTKETTNRIIDITHLTAKEAHCLVYSKLPCSQVPTLAIERFNDHIYIITEHPYKETIL